MTTIFAIDPGTEQSGFVTYTEGVVDNSGVLPNAEILSWIAGRGHPALHEEVAIEMVASYGMPVGKEVFETCVWIGRFQQASAMPERVRLVYRRDVKLHLCGTAKAKDGNIRQALLDLYPRTGGGAVPQIGVKAKPGPLFGISTHAWAALGVAVTVAAQMRVQSLKAA